MRRIGLLGGMSWESSIEYERIINEAVRARLGGTHSADLVIRADDRAAIPDHHYFLAENRSWLLVATTEGDVDVIELARTQPSGEHR